MPYDDNVDRRTTDGPTAAVVIVGGDPLPEPVAVAVRELVAAGDTIVVAADSGVDHALAAGVRPDLVVGDLDSISEAGLAWARGGGVEVHEFPPAKDVTDTEIALATAAGRGVTDIVMVGGGGDRLDHSIGALTALGHASMAALGSLSALWSDSTVHVLHGPRSLEVDLPSGTTFSLLALHGRCTGVGEAGVEWPLVDAVIEPGSSLGVSNVARSATITVSVLTGVLTLVVPFHTARLISPAGRP